MMPYFIVLFFYATLALIFISINIFYPQKYINFICLSHISGIITVTCFILSKSAFYPLFLDSTALFFFLCSIFFAFVSLNCFVERRFSAKYTYFFICFVIADLFFNAINSPFSTFLNKIVLMSIFLYFGINILKNNNKIFTYKILGIVIIVFSLIQMSFGIVRLFVLKKELFIDLAFYVIQSMTYSFCLISTSIESMHIDNHDNKKLLEEAYELSNLKNEFIANISHELRTPINIIYSSLQVMELNLDDYKNNDEKLKYYIKIMKQNCFRLLKLTNNLIDINKIKVGSMELYPTNCDIVCLIEDVTLSVVPYAEQKNICLQFDTDFEEKILSCDMEKIERIMLNLLSNAIKFTKDGGEILVNMTERDEQVFISVKDNGIGIPKDMQNIIFNRFTQVHNSFDSMTKGSGIGLSLVKSLVEMHEGKLELLSSENEGSCFTFSLPNKIMNKGLSDCKMLNEISIKNIEIEFSDILA